MVYTSKFPPKYYPADKSMYNFLFSKTENIPQNKLIYMDIENIGKSLTYAQVHTQILKCTAGFKREFGLKHGDVVAICSPNQVDYSVVVHGTVCAGGIAAAIDHNSTPEKIASDLDVVQAKILIAHEDTLYRALTAANIYGLSTENILIFGDYGIKGIRTANETILSGHELGTPYDYTADQIQHDPAYLYFTSGTTGRKKAVKITQSMLIATMLIKDFWFPAESNILAYTEFHHVSSLVSAIHLPIYCGFSTYVMPHYSLRNLCAAIEKHQINITTTQPYIVAALAKDSIAQEYDISSLKVVICCGAALEHSVTLFVMEQLGLKIINTYGMTEAIGIFDTNENISLINGIGYLASGFTAKLIDEEGKEISTVNETGELLIKGPTITLGYYKNPEATAAAIDSEDFLHTGDLVRCNQDGMFTYINRSKDLIKYYLAHIHPSDIENVLMSHPKVADCAAIGVYYPELTTELPRAYVLLVDGERYSEEIEHELQEYSNSRLPDEKKLRGGIVIVDSFPRTASGKIQRRLLNQQSKERISV